MWRRRRRRAASLAATAATPPSQPRPTSPCSTGLQRSACFRAVQRLGSTLSTDIAYANLPACNSLQLIAALQSSKTSPALCTCIIEPTHRLTNCCSREELLENLPVAEVEEMQTAVADALEAVAGSGWRFIPVGGGARGIRFHDCDFVVTHDSNK